MGPLPDSGRTFRPAGAKPFANVISIDMASLRDEGMLVQNRIGAPAALDHRLLLTKFISGVLMAAVTTLCGYWAGHEPWQQMYCCAKQVNQSNS